MKIQQKAEKSGKKWKNVKKSVFSRPAGIPVSLLRLWIFCV
jgi:hypothetical protein